MKYLIAISLFVCCFSQVHACGKRFKPPAEVTQAVKGGCCDDGTCSDDDNKSS